MSQPASKPSDAPRQRLISLDQFRGYTVAGMWLVNFLGDYAAGPLVLRHTFDHVGYADTIMPQFLFAVGFAFRLTFGRRAAKEGLPAAYAHMVRRLLALALIALVLYQVGPRAPSWQKLTELDLSGLIVAPVKMYWFQALMQIAVTTLWLLPVIRAGITVRILWIVGSAAVQVALSYWFNFAWVNEVPVYGTDGGPFGFLTWTIPAGVGTLACDAIVSPRSRWSVASMFGWSVLLMGLGYLMSCGTRVYDVPPAMVKSLADQKLAEDPVWPSRERIEAKRNHGGLAEMLAEPPFVSPPGPDHRKWNYWMMSLQAGTVSYLTFSAGFSLAVYLLFYVVCDWYGWQLPLFRTLGTNALVAYILDVVVGVGLSASIPKDSPGWYVVAGLVVFFLLNWLFLRGLEKRGIYLRV